MHGLLIDYGGTLVEELSVDARAGNTWLLAHASVRPPDVTVERVLDRAARITREVVAKRDELHLETPWPAIMRLIHEPLGVRFDAPIAELELGYWEASVRTRPLPGAREALDALARAGIALGVVSNTMFSERVIRHELARHGLTAHLTGIVVSSEYAVRKPNRYLFDIGAARLGVAAADIWFVGDRLDTDVAGARAAGMTAVWLRPPAASKDADSSHAHVVVPGWRELLSRALPDAGTRV